MNDNYSKMLIKSLFVILIFSKIVRSQVSPNLQDKNIPPFFKPEDFEACGLTVNTLQRGLDCSRYLCLLKTYDLLNNTLHIDYDALQSLANSSAAAAEDSVAAKIQNVREGCAGGILRGPPFVCEADRLVNCILVTFAGIEEVPARCRAPPPAGKKPNECCKMPPIFKDKDFEACGFEKRDGPNGQGPPPPFDQFGPPPPIGRPHGPPPPMMGNGPQPPPGGAYGPPPPTSGRHGHPPPGHHGPPRYGGPYHSEMGGPPRPKFNQDHYGSFGPRHHMPDCSKEVCILHAYSLTEEDGTIKNEALEGFFDNFAEENPTYKEAVDKAKAQCSGVSASPAGVCAAHQLIHCVITTLVDECPDWEDTEECGSVKAYIQECRGTQPPPPPPPYQHYQP